MQYKMNIYNKREQKIGLFTATKTSCTIRTKNARLKRLWNKILKEGIEMRCGGNNSGCVHTSIVNTVIRFNYSNAGLIEKQLIEKGFLTESIIHDRKKLNAKTQIGECANNYFMVDSDRTNERSKILKQPRSKKVIYEHLMSLHGNCHYCEITGGVYNKLFGEYREGRRGKRLELDKKDPKGEYSMENCVLACYSCNNAKSDIFTYQEFKVIGKTIKNIWVERLPINNPSKGKIRCSICNVNLDSFYKQYPNPVCNSCDDKALNINDKPAQHAGEQEEHLRLCNKTGEKWLPPDGGDNPVFINGKKCWRRYKFGGWVTMMDKDDCEDIRDFYYMNRMYIF